MYMYSSNDIENDLHFLISCDAYENERENLVNNALGTDYSQLEQSR